MTIPDNPCIEEAREIWATICDPEDCTSAVTHIATALTKRYNEGLEAAAKVCDAELASCRVTVGVGRCADAIRALRQGGESGQ